MSLIASFFLTLRARPLKVAGILCCMAGSVACNEHETTADATDSDTGSPDATDTHAGNDTADDGATTDAAHDTLPDTPESDTAEPNDADAGDADLADVDTTPPLRGLDCLESADCTHPMVAAHRGVHDVVPENSLASIRLGAELGVDFVELDVQHTADDALVVVHDGTVDRTTDGTGAVNAMTLAELRALSLLGATDDPETQRIPTFAEALEYAVRYDLDLYLDVKTNRIELVVDAIVEAGALEHAWIRDDLEPIQRALDHAQTTHGVSLAVLVPAETVAELEAARAAVPQRLSIEIPGGAGVPTDVVAAARAAGIRVQQDALGFADIFGLDNDPSAWQAMIDAGVDVLQTDLPRPLLEYLR